MLAIVAGDREYEDADDVYGVLDWIDETYGISQVVSGTARGVDRIGEEWAEEMKVPCKRFPANWNEQGKAAGPIRNRQMADYVMKACAETGEMSGLVAFLHPESVGTKNMVTTATAKGFDFVLSLRIER